MSFFGVKIPLVSERDCKGTNIFLIPKFFQENFFNFFHWHHFFMASGENIQEKHLTLKNGKEIGHYSYL